MDVDHPGHDGDDAPRIAQPVTADSRTRRSVWTMWRRLVWTSTVASACSTTRVQTAPVPEPLPTSYRGETRLAMRSGEVVSMYNATIVGDSIVGITPDTREAQNPRRIAVARADVSSVTTKKLSIGKTLLAALGGVVATFTFVVLLACASLATA